MGSILHVDFLETVTKVLHDLRKKTLPKQLKNIDIVANRKINMIRPCMTSLDLNAYDILTPRCPSGVCTPRCLPGGCTPRCPPGGCTSRCPPGGCTPCCPPGGCTPRCPPGGCIPPASSIYCIPLCYQQREPSITSDLVPPSVQWPPSFLRRCPLEYCLNAWANTVLSILQTCPNHRTRLCLVTSVKDSRVNVSSDLSISQPANTSDTPQATYVKNTKRLCLL